MKKRVLVRYKAKPDRVAENEALVRQGITVGELVPIPYHLIPDDAKVEMEAKIAAGYFSPRTAKELATTVGRGLDE